jgi:hypothetical protein
MTYTISGKKWTILNINERCAEILAWESESNVKSVEFDGDCFWVGHLKFSPYAVFKPFAVKDYCSNPADTDAIIDKCRDELNKVNVSYDSTGRMITSTKWNYIMIAHECTKLTAACIFFIELNTQLTLNSFMYHTVI